MIGLFYKKYHIAIYDEDKSFINHISNVIKTWFKHSVVVESYTDTYQMFVGLNMAKAKNAPFDMTIVGHDKNKTTCMVIKKTNPEMKVVSYVDDIHLKEEAKQFNDNCIAL